MNDGPQRTNAEVLDVLYAVALGEGFISGIYGLKDQIVSGEVLMFGAAGQELCRVLLGFVVIILSWLYYKKSTLTARIYPTGEFVIDIVIMITYMTLFLFVDTPVAYYSVLSAIWLLYLVARLGFAGRSPVYLLFGMTFVGVFALLAVSASTYGGAVAEWARLLLVTIVISAYRPLDRKFLPAK